MDTSLHNFSALFDQLGLSHDKAAINEFIETHSPLPESVRLMDATFWSQAQAGFIREALEEDSDWAELVDQLDASLRGLNASQLAARDRKPYA